MRPASPKYIYLSAFLASLALSIWVIYTDLYIKKDGVDYI